MSGAPRSTRITLSGALPIITFLLAVGGGIASYVMAVEKAQNASITHNAVIEQRVSKVEETARDMVSQFNVINNKLDSISTTVYRMEGRLIQQDKDSK